LARPACHTCRIATTSITVSVRQLHARTGHYLRKASKNQRLIVTDNGKPIIELTPLAPEAESEVAYFARRKLLPGFKKLMESGKLRRRPGQRDITDLISEDRDLDHGLF
jgi:prevent-host-death family protein